MPKPLLLQQTWEILVASPDLLRDPKPGGIKARDFLQGMMNRMSVSYHRYGSFHEAFPQRKTGIANCCQRMEKYWDDGNVEWLIDAANYLMMEAACPSHPDAHFRATSTEESPGSVLTDGSSDMGGRFAGSALPHPAKKHYKREGD